MRRLLLRIAIAMPGPLRRKAAVLAFWEGIAARYESTIQTSELREPARGKVFRAASLRHVDRAGGPPIGYRFEQVTEIAAGQVVVQRNAVVG